MSRADHESPAKPVAVSVVITARDEEESVPLLGPEVERAMDATGLPWECIWVDDGSTDRTLDRIRELRRGRREHRFISLVRNYGQSAALMAGFRAAAGKVIATLDADLQNDPADLPVLLAEMDRLGADMVNGYRARRKDSRVRMVSSRIANGFRNRMTDEHVRDVGCSLRVFRRECAEFLPVFRGMHRFLPTLVRIQGYRIAEVPVRHRPRRYGRTKYGIGNRLWVGIYDTLGVRWLAARGVFPRVGRTSEEENAERNGPKLSARSGER